MEEEGRGGTDGRGTGGRGEKRRGGSVVHHLLLSNLTTESDPSCSSQF